MVLINTKSYNKTWHTTFRRVS